MALFANDTDTLIDAWDAERGKLYFCVECGGPLRVRRKKHQIPHFYHLKRSPSCRLYNKSERHLLIQREIQKQLPFEESAIEKPFPSIGRIADLCWETEKVIFEIQCSPISPNEAKDRIEEYASIGYEVVWILDDRIFNQKHARPAEELLRKKTTYFVSGKGPFEFYDQLEILHNGKRVKKGAKSLIDLTTKRETPRSNPFLTNKMPSLPLFPFMEEKLANSKIYFKNDLIDKILNREDPIVKILPLWNEFARNLLQSKQAKPFAFIDFLKKRFKRLYFLLLHFLFKRS